MQSEIDIANLAKPAADPALWPLDPEIIFLNHGSFGSCPKPVLDRQTELRRLMEREPITFLVRELEERMDASRLALAGFVGAAQEDLVFVPNATSGVNAVLRSLQFGPKDELLVTDQEYNACRNALNFAAERSGAKIVVAPVRFPIAGPDDFLESVLSRVTSRTRLVLTDHVTSQTGLVLPVRELATALASRGVDLLVDGAHAPGMVPLNLSMLGATYYTGNCHKWVCSPKGAGFLHVRRDRQSQIRPLTISHGANSPRKDRSRFQIEFAWTGTWDPTAMMAVADAIQFMGELAPGGWDAIMNRNRQLALEARRMLCIALEIAPPAPEEMIGSMASVPISDADSTVPPKSPLYLDAWQDRLMSENRIEVPIIPWPAAPRRLLRISAQLYNSSGQYQILAEALKRMMREV